MKSKKVFENLILPLISLICVVLIWVIASKITNSEYILPSFFTTIKATFKILATAKFYGALLSTLLRVVIAFVVSFALAFALAFWGYKSSKAKKIISPIMSIIRALPTIAVVLLLLFWTNSFVAPVVVTILVVLPTVYTGVGNALEGLDKDLIEIFGHLDAMKVRSCMTLFYHATGDKMFMKVIEKFFGGVEDGVTVELLQGL